MKKYVTTILTVLCFSLIAQAQAGRKSLPAPPKVTIRTLQLQQSTPTGQHSVTLSWTQSTSTITTNCVYRSTISGSSYSQVYCSLTPITSWVDSPLSSGTYYYVVTALNGASESGYSNQATAVVFDVASPTSLVAQQTSASAVTLTWAQSTTTGITSNSVYWSTTTGGPYTLLYTSTTPITTWLDSGVASGTYYYVVTASVNTIESPYSTQSTVTVVTVLPPTGLTAQQTK